MTDQLLSLAAAILAAAAAEDAPAGIARTIFTGPLFMVIDVGLVLIPLAIGVCLVRLLRGPELADRIIAGDVIALQVVGLVILLTVRQESDTYLDVALTVAIIGFVTTVAFSRYLVATNGKEDA